MSAGATLNESGSMKSASRKIVSLSELATIAADLRKHGFRVGLCHGKFDFLHPGFIQHLIAAKKQVDVLAVALTADRFIQVDPDRQGFNEVLRAESIAAIESVNYVCVVDYPNAIETIQQLRPSCYIKGSEFARPQSGPTGTFHDEMEALRAVGGEVCYTDEVTFPTTHLINSEIRSFPPETDKWLRDFSAKHTLPEIHEWLDRLGEMKVLIVGEAIIDEYAFCSGLGKAAKDPILAFLYSTTETYAGGSLAVANHAAGFSSNVTLITLLGETERREDFVRRALRPQVSLRIVTQENAPTLHKRRFVDSHTGNKLFELYLMNDGALSTTTEDQLLLMLDEELPRHDVVIVPDYGHGMMTPKVIAKLAEGARFLVINTQTNAGNRGFNNVSRYSRADYICIAGHELALEMRSRSASYQSMLEEFAEKMSCPRYTVTLGNTGTVHYEKNAGFCTAPSLATKVVDRVGAGDAVLTVTGMLVSSGAPWAIVGLIGNAVGAVMVGDLGNRVAMDKGLLLKYVAALMK